MQHAGAGGAAIGGGTPLAGCSRNRRRGYWWQNSVTSCATEKGHGQCSVPTFGGAAIGGGTPAELDQLRYRGG